MDELIAKVEAAVGRSLSLNGSCSLHWEREPEQDLSQNHDMELGHHGHEHELEEQDPTPLYAGLADVLGPYGKVGWGPTGSGQDSAGVCAASPNAPSKRAVPMTLALPPPQLPQQPLFDQWGYPIPAVNHLSPCERALTLFRDMQDNVAHELKVHAARYRLTAQNLAYNLDSVRGCLV